MPRSRKSNNFEEKALEEFNIHLRSLTKTPISKPLHTYIKEQIDLLDFFYNIVYISSTTDKVRVFLEQAIEKDSLDFDEIQLTEKDEILFTRLKRVSILLERC